MSKATTVEVDMPEAVTDDAIDAVVDLLISITEQPPT